jgi:glycosyltransferase involved in cell wall biosynthesis
LKISVVIPTYEAYGAGVAFLSRLLDSIMNQSFKDVEIIVSDHSGDNAIANFLENKPVVYVRNERMRGSSSANLNNAIEHSSGDIIKPMFMDDYFHDANALSIIHDRFIGGASWVAVGVDVSDSTHHIKNFIPKWNDRVVFGHNTISSPSAIAYLRCDLKWDERLIWLMDCKFYRDLYDKFGLPAIEEQVLITNFLHSKQLTHTMGRERQKMEEDLIRKEYKE